MKSIIENIIEMLLIKFLYGIIQAQGKTLDHFLLDMLSSDKA